MNYHPMLASPSKTPIDELTGDWVFEPKYDGMRCLSVWGGLISRAGNDITDRFPEINMQHTPACHMVLDGEIMMFDPDTGLPSFNQVQRRTGSNARSDNPAVFMVFDVLAMTSDGITPEDYRRFPLHERRRMLESIHMQGRLPQHVTPVPQMDDGLSMWNAAISLGYEGVMAKHTNSLYSAGRSDAWRKYKQKHRVSCVVVGAEAGKGHTRDTFGALHLAMRDQSEIVTVGKVGSGFTGEERAHITGILAKGEPFVVEVEYQEVTKDGKLRFPVYVGLRNDISIIECTTDQLEKA